MRVRVFEDLFDRTLEQCGDREGNRERWIELAGLDRMHALPGNPDLLAKLGLGPSAFHTQRSETILHTRPGQPRLGTIGPNSDRSVHHQVRVAKSVGEACQCHCANALFGQMRNARPCCIGGPAEHPLGSRSLP